MAENVKKEIEAYINSNYEEVMKSRWPMVKMFVSEETPDEKQFGYEMGWIMALGWMGNLLGLELAQPDKESKDKIDALFREVDEMSDKPKVGDKVRIVTDAWGMKGYRGEICDICEEKGLWAIDFGENNKGSIHWYYFDDFKISDDKEVEVFDSILNQKIEDLPLSVRAINVLRCNDIETLRDLVKIERKDFLKYRNSGKKTCTELDDLLSDKGLTWGMNV